MQIELTHIRLGGIRIPVRRQIDLNQEEVYFELVNLHTGQKERKKIDIEAEIRRLLSEGTGIVEANGK